MQRILVIGSPGAGKSVFATKLAAVSGLPLVHLDQHYWLPGWVEPDDAAWHVRLQQIIAGDRWIIDGNYGGSMALRMTRADTVIVLDYPSWLCVTRLLGRIARTRGNVRPDMADGCTEQFNLGFIGYTATFRWHRWPAVEARLANFPGQIIRLRRPADADQYLADQAASAS